MSHVDDGRLNALLDGELSGSEARAVEAHAAQCADCRRRLEEARAFLQDAGAMLESLGPLGAPVAASPVATPAPSAPAQPATPARRIAKTAKEVAVEIDGRTAMTPAIRPVFPDEVPQAPARRRGWDVEKLAWAASIVLALGVGYLGNESLHMHRLYDDMARAPRSAAQPAAQHGTSGPAATPRQVAARPPAEAATTAAAPAPPASTASHQAGRDAGHAAEQRTASPYAAGPAHPPTKVEPSRPDAATRTDAARGSPSPTLTKPTRALVKTPPAVVASAGTGGAARTPRSAADEPATTTRPSAAAAQQAGRTADNAAGASALGALSTQPPAPSDRAAASHPAAPPPAGARTRAATLDEVSAQPTPGFQHTTMEEAARLLSGSIRQIDGMRLARVESASGRLVGGADASRSVVRVTYTDQVGRRYTLDQQLAEPRTGRAFNGIMPGDTLVTITADSNSRVRWMDGRFWLSLSGPVPADQLKALVGRVR